MNFADRLKALRKEKALTQEEFAKKINKNRSTVAGYETERKQPEYETLINIAKALDVSVDYLLGNDKEPAPGTSASGQNLVSLDGLTDEEIEHIRGLITVMKKRSTK